MRAAETDQDGAYLQPRCTPRQLDRYIARTTILRHLRDVLPNLSGLLLDVGCGHRPYESLIHSEAPAVTRYVGFDLVGSTRYTLRRPDVYWDGRLLPLGPASVGGVLLTEVLEHCAHPEQVLGEVHRVLAPGGRLFLTVPFLWPLHDVPADEFRYTPFAIQRLLCAAGFEQVVIRALGGWHAGLAQLLALYARRALPSRPARVALTILAWPLVWLLYRLDRPCDVFTDGTMLTGLSATAVRPSAR